MKVKLLDKTTVKDYFDICKVVDVETPFLLLKPEERKFDCNEENRILTEFENTMNIGFVGYINNVPSGYILGLRKKNSKCKHVINIIIAVKEKYQGSGIAKRLIHSLESYCKKSNIQIIRLSVLESNIRAIKFYLNNGFKIEGVLTNNIILDKKFYSEYSMFKKIEKWR